ncbi:Adenovirus e3 region domain containing protein [Ceratobasidium theobromae]|uniref:Adenovirus e3 region domain containing protein n=1 Tax=Ceratobasidium theobromae TaxID=1582974 RepID=A0A5N5Q9I8_9AGAM|nr:Adenovirus e3 region domain containing protein [Ceratobasidium theobromae]
MTTDVSRAPARPLEGLEVDLADQAATVLVNHTLLPSGLDGGDDTIPNTSSTLYYTPFVSNSTSDGGWTSLCPRFDGEGGGYVCDSESAHTSSSENARVYLEFEGSAVYLFGNTTGDLGYAIRIDEEFVTLNSQPEIELLHSSVGLGPGPHSITLFVQKPLSISNPGSVTFREAVVTSRTGYSGATVTRNVWDNEHPNITYNAPISRNWTISDDIYPQFVRPEGSGSSYRYTTWPNATATINFRGIGISVYGGCNSRPIESGYSASIDDSLETSYDAITNLYTPWNTTEQRAGNCLRYFKAGLNETKDHTLVLRVTDIMGQMSIDWVEIFTATGGNVRVDRNGGGAGSVQGSHSRISRVGITAGIISGVVALILVTLGVCFCLRWRRRSIQQDGVAVPEDQNRRRFPIIPFGVNRPPPTTLPQMGVDPDAALVVPPWPQLQGSTAGRVHRAAPDIGAEPVVQVSVVSLDTPNTSPPLSSNQSYSETNGVGMGNPVAQGILSRNASSTRADYHDGATRESSGGSHPPPAYGQLQGTYAVTQVGTG